jgi:putative ABC transport system ATP-binding protein
VKSADPCVELENVSVSYGQGASTMHALDGVSLSVAHGEFVAVTGPSGSGKTTLLNVVAALQRPTAGRVIVGGVDLSRSSDAELSRMRRRTLGYVFQFFNLLPQLTARENVALPLEADGQRARVVAERVERALDLVGMHARASHLPCELSGGEMQRIAIARVLASDARLILADEPTGNLDSGRGTELMDLLRLLVDREGRSLILVTHDMSAAARGDRLVRLRDGRVEALETLVNQRAMPMVCAAAS